MILSVVALCTLLTAIVGLIAFMNVHTGESRDVRRVGVSAPQATVWAVLSTPESTAAPTAAPTEQPSPTPTPEPTPEPMPVTITITATGDVTLGTYTTGNGRPSSFKAAVEKCGYEYFLENYRNYFSQDDLTIVNLEGPLSAHSEKRAGRTFNFRGYPEYANILSSASVEVCNLANNHALDYRQEGFDDTCDALAGAGIGASGYGPEYYAEVKGRTVGFLGFTEWNFEKSEILNAVAEASQKCDLLIVSMHWGEEGYDTFTKYSARMGEALVDAGADLVIGNHPHVPGAIRKYKGRYIIHTLGNFCFGGNDTPGRKVRRSAVFRQRFVLQPDGSVEDGGIDIVPGWISGQIKYNDFHPIVAETEDGIGILQDIVKASKGEFQLEDALWLDDSYVYQRGILQRTGDAAATEGIENIET